MTRPQAILTDIEGTTSSISFVKDVLFPYARRAMPAYVREHGGHPQVRHWLNQVADEIGEDVPDEVLITTLQTWIDEDRKHTALKALQGMIWEDGYRTADFSAHIYTDAAIQLRPGMRKVFRCTCIRPVRCRRRSCSSHIAMPAT